MRASKEHTSKEQELCLACGLCCNGVIFADLKLKRGEHFPVPVPRITRTRTIPDSTKSPHGVCRIPQPCPALEGCRCTIYENRPRHCRQFECLLFKRVQSGEARLSRALATIRKTRQQVDRVMHLLRALGDTDEELPLAKRFRRTSARLENIGIGGEAADQYRELTVAVHELILVLSDQFYPGG